MSRNQAVDARFGEIWQRFGLFKEYVTDGDIQAAAVLTQVYFSERDRMRDLAIERKKKKAESSILSPLKHGLRWWRSR